MATYVYVTATGLLYSYNPDDVSPVAAKEDLARIGLTVVSALPPLDETHEWDPSGKTVVAKVLPTPAKPISTAAWLSRFTPQETANLRTSQDLTVQHFLFVLRHTISLDLNDEVIIAAMNYMIGKNFLTQERVAAIMT